MLDSTMLTILEVQQLPTCLLLEAGPVALQWQKNYGEWG